MVDSLCKWVLSFMIVGAWFALSYLVIGGHIDSTDPQKLLLIGSAYGSVTTITGGVISYHYGSTKASAAKDKIISDMTASLPPAASTTTVTASATKTVDPTQPS